MTDLIARRGILGLAAAAAGLLAVATPAAASSEMQWRRYRRRGWVVRRRRWYDEPYYVERYPYGPPRRYGLSARDRMLIDRQQVPSSYGGFGSPFF